MIGAKWAHLCYYILIMAGQDTSKAQYDENGNIIIGGHTEVTPPALQPADLKQMKKTGWNLRSQVGGVLTEGKRQYSSSAKAIHSQWKSFPAAFKKFWSQPVWVMNKKKKAAKEYSRGTLFALDIVRFGSTFSFIFAVLFVGLNFKSFWEIASYRLSPVQYAQNQRAADVEAVTTNTPSQISERHKRGKLLEYLTQVGPPDNRLVIPKLSLNVPIQIPPFESLINEDWAQVEEDIQTALEDGVVHYPGTAKPGMAGNFFVTGHSSYFAWKPGDYKNVFARLHDLEVGDEYYVYYGGDKHRYVVSEKKIVKPSNVDVLNQPTNQRISTLMTCSPVGTTISRLILKATEVDPITGLALEVGEQAVRAEQMKSKPAMLPI